MATETQDTRHKTQDFIPAHSKEEIMENLRSRIEQGQADIAKIESLIHKRGVEKSINFYRSILYYLENE
jgi:hypothetical protein